MASRQVESRRGGWVVIDEVQRLPSLLNEGPRAHCRTWPRHRFAIVRFERATIAYEGVGGDIHYWRTPSGSEVDFIWTRARTRRGIE